jgi:CelD/BcsL family acetyltransferase involved in cellulose biosynthesis
MITSTTRTPRQPHTAFEVRRLPFADIPRRVWDRLLAATPAATPFSRWTFHRAWWDAYGGSARQHYLVVLAPTGDHSTRVLDTRLEETAVRAIAPFMLRSPDGDGEAPTLSMAASYHADYATILAGPDDIQSAVDAVVVALLESHGDPDSWPAWRAADLRRLREGDPVLSELASAFSRRGGARGYRVSREVEDVCPVVRLAPDWDSLLAGLDKRARHEIRRKLRRAARAGSASLRYVPLEADSVTRFIRLHQARWGADGLFPSTADGEASRHFLRRLAELERAEGTSASLHLAEVSIGERVVCALAGFSGGGTCYFYNTGLDPEALGLSPGVVGTAAYLRDRIAAGDTRFDFLRGDEAYKYEWGAVDEHICRLLVERRDDRG